MKRMFFLSGLVAAGLFLTAPAGAIAGSGVQFDSHGRAYVVLKRGGKHVRVYCEKAFYGKVRCPQVRKQLQFGPYSREFAFSQGYQYSR